MLLVKNTTPIHTKEERDKLIKDIDEVFKDVKNKEEKIKPLTQEQLNKVLNDDEFWKNMFK